VTATAFTQRIYGTGGLPGFIVGMLLVGAGTGTVKPNITVFLSKTQKAKHAMLTRTDLVQLTSFLKKNRRLLL
jgi:dipeptide/tripeptide permease